MIKAPPKKPPNIGKKPEKKTEAVEGEKAAEPPKKGPPVLSSQKPAASSSGGGGGPGKPMTPEMVVEEDLGPGMGKETAFAKVEEYYPADTLALLAEDKPWKEKVEGLQGMIK